MIALISMRSVVEPTATEPRKCTRNCRIHNDISLTTFDFSPRVIVVSAGIRYLKHFLHCQRDKIFLQMCILSGQMV